MHCAPLALQWLIGITLFLCVVTMGLVSAAMLIQTVTELKEKKVDG